MDFCKKNCNVFQKFYNYTLAKGYGVGTAQLGWKDYLYSYLNSNFGYFEPQTGSTDMSTEFIGVILENNVLIPGAIASQYYINDQDAFNHGVQKLDFYLLALNNTYGSPYGTPKRLVEDVT